MSEPVTVTLVFMEEMGNCLMAFASDGVHLGLAVPEGAVPVPSGAHSDEMKSWMDLHRQKLLDAVSQSEEKWEDKSVIVTRALEGTVNWSNGLSWRLLGMGWGSVDVGTLEVEAAPLIAVRATRSAKVA